MSEPNSLSPAMQARYGLAPQRGRKLAWVGVILVVVAAVLGAWQYRATHHITSFRLLAFDVVSQHRVNVTFEVAQPKDVQIYCVVRAQNELRQDVGYATVAVPRGQLEVQYTYPLNTESLAVVAEVLQCSESLAMRVPPANFPPGVKIPSQPAPGVAPSQK